jgi:predicted dehydrogenase
VLQSTAGAWGPSETLTRVAGSRGTAWIDDDLKIGAIESVSGTVRLATGPNISEVRVPEHLRLPADAALDARYHRNVLPYTRVYEIMVRAIAGETPVGATVPATFEDGVANMRVLAAIRTSAAEGGRLINL